MKLTKSLNMLHLRNGYNKPIYITRVKYSIEIVYKFIVKYNRS